MGLIDTPPAPGVSGGPAMPKLHPTFEALHAEYRAKVHSYLCRFVEPAEAEDLTQEVFLKVHRNLATFRQESRISTWIFQIATHAALDRLKRPSRRILDQRSLLIEKLDASGLHATPGHGQVPLREEMCRCIQDFVGELPGNYRAILFLSDLKELGIEEIAQILGITPGAAKIRLHRARQALKAHMERGCRISLDERGELSCDRK